MSTCYVTLYGITMLLLDGKHHFQHAVPGWVRFWGLALSRAPLLNNKE